MARMPRRFIRSGLLLLFAGCSGCTSTAKNLRSAYQQYIGPSASWRHLDAPLDPQLVWHSDGGTRVVGKGKVVPRGHYGNGK